MAMGVTIDDRHYRDRHAVPPCTLHEFVRCEEGERPCHQGRERWLSGCRMGVKRHV